MSVFSTYWTVLLRTLFPWAATLFIAVSFTGSEYFLVVVIAVGYWAIDKRLAKQGALLLLFSAVSNYLLKITIKHPRPPQSNWLPGVTASNYSLPSGHAESSTVIWGWIGIKRNEKWVRIGLTALILLVGISRVYLGVHWFGDVLFGWFVGLAILGVVSQFEDKLFDVVDSPKFDAGLIVLGVLSMLGFRLLSTYGVGGDFGSLGGLMVGVGAGFLLERRYVKFTTKDIPVRKRILRALIGLSLLLFMMFGLSGFLPSGVFWTHEVRYALVAVTALSLYPRLFMWLRI